MAVGVGANVMIEESGYLSDESEFYGMSTTWKAMLRAVLT
jgi:hypothetical protein